ncbi:hypothetical protein HK405_007782, partial [Cladochytrium tenue]
VAAIVVNSLWSADSKDCPVPTLGRAASTSIAVDNHTDPQAASVPRSGLRTIDFIQELLRRSKTSFSTLQLALFYLVRLHGICLATKLTTQGMQKDAVAILQRSYSSAPDRQADVAVAPTQTVENSAEMEFEHAGKEPEEDAYPHNFGSAAALAAVTGDARRTFLAALVLASKYLNDRTYSSRAWSRMCGLPVAEINRAERTLLLAMDHRLHVSRDAFRAFSARLVSRAIGFARRAAPWQAPSGAPSGAPSVLIGSPRLDAVAVALAVRAGIKRAPADLDDTEAQSSGSLEHFVAGGKRIRAF